MIYIPIIRDEIHQFADDHNTHPIRKQNRPNGVFGKPFMLYYHPKGTARNCGMQPPLELLTTLENDVEAWGKSSLPFRAVEGLQLRPIVDRDAFLPAETFRWCQEALRRLGYEITDDKGNPKSYDRGSPHQEIYLALRDEVQRHINSGNEPALALLPHPTGAADWQPTNMKEIMQEFEADGSEDPVIFDSDP